MVSILSDLKATLESAFSIGSAAISGARDLVFRNPAGTITVRGNPTGTHIQTLPDRSGTIVHTDQVVLNTINRQTLSGNLTLDSSSAVFQLLDPNGANRNIDLPVGAVNLRFKIENIAASGTAFNLVVRDNGSTTIATLPAQYVAEFFWDGSTWQQYVVQNPANVALTGGTANNLSTLSLNGAAASFTLFFLRADGVNRWSIGRFANNQNFYLVRYNSSGAVVDTPLVIDAANGEVGFTPIIRLGAVVAAQKSQIIFYNSTGATRIVNTPGSIDVEQVLQPRAGTIANLDQTLQISNNLSDLASVPTARTNLGLGTIATQNATAVDVAGKRTAIVVTGNITLDATHIGRKLLVTAGPTDITFPSTLGAQGDEIEIVVLTTAQVRVVQGASATLTWYSGSAAVTGTRTFLGNATMAAIIFSGTGTAAISGGLS